MSDWRLIVAFKAPPPSYNFVPAKSGKCWIRTIDGLEWALEIGRQLRELGIRGVIKKIDRPRVETFGGSWRALAAAAVPAVARSTRTAGCSAASRKASNRYWRRTLYR